MFGGLVAHIYPGFFGEEGKCGKGEGERGKEEKEGGRREFCFVQDTKSTVCLFSRSRGSGSEFEAGGGGGEEETRVEQGRL